MLCFSLLRSSAAAAASNPVRVTLIQAVVPRKAFELRAVWMRDPVRTFGPSEFLPDMTVSSLEKLCDELQQQSRVHKRTRRRA
jgi:hypothetical protein